MKSVLLNIIVGFLYGSASGWIFNHVNPWAGLALFVLCSYLVYHFNKTKF